MSDGILPFAAQTSLGPAPQRRKKTKKYPRLPQGQTRVASMWVRSHQI